MNRFNAIPLKIPAGKYVNINKLTLKFIWYKKELKQPKCYLKRKVEAIIQYDFKTDFIKPS